MAKGLWGFHLGRAHSRRCGGTQIGFPLVVATLEDVEWAMQGSKIFKNIPLNGKCFTYLRKIGYTHHYLLQNVLRIIVSRPNIAYSNFEPRGGEVCCKQY